MTRNVLLIEDDAGIATMLSLALPRWGYKVLKAADCRMAVELAEVYRDEISVVLCDVLLPDGSGPAAAASVLRHCPGALTIFTSGYPVDVLADRGLLSLGLLVDLGASYLPKPFLPADVHRLIDRALGAEVARSAVSVNVPIFPRGHAGYTH